MFTVRVAGLFFIRKLSVIRHKDSAESIGTHRGIACGIRILTNLCISPYKIVGSINFANGRAFIEFISFQVFRVCDAADGSSIFIISWNQSYWFAYHSDLPFDEYFADDEPHVFNDRVYIYGSHDVIDYYGGGCAGNYEAYSAPVDNLADWTYEGVLYDKTEDPGYQPGMNMLASDFLLSSIRKLCITNIKTIEYKKKESNSLG